MLVSIPASLRLVWAEELEKWLPHLRPSSIHVIEGKTDRLQGSDLPAVCITSYEMMKRLTCDACKGTDGRPVVLYACAGSQVCMQWTMKEPTLIRKRLAVCITTYEMM